MYQTRFAALIEDMVCARTLQEELQVPVHKQHEACKQLTWQERL